MSEETTALQEKNPSRMRRVLDEFTGKRSREDERLLKTMQQYGGEIKELSDGTLELNTPTTGEPYSKLACAARLAYERKVDVHGKSSDLEMTITPRDATDVLDEICSLYPEQIKGEYSTKEGRPNDKMRQIAAVQASGALLHNDMTRFIEQGLDYENLSPIFQKMLERVNSKSE